MTKQELELVRRVFNFCALIAHSQAEEENGLEGRVDEVWRLCAITIANAITAAGNEYVD